MEEFLSKRLLHYLDISASVKLSQTAGLYSVKYIESGEDWHPFYVNLDNFICCKLDFTFASHQADNL